MGIQIKKYRAASLQQAIEEVRNDLGDDAVILQTESLKAPGLLGRTMIEVTAAIDRKNDIVKFHATVGEDEYERPEPTVAGAGKMGWLQSLLGKKSAAQVHAGIPKQITTPKPAVQKFARAAAAAAPQAPVGAESVNQMYALKTFIEPLQKEIAGLKSKIEGGPQRPPRKRLQDPLEIEVQQLRSELSSFILEKRYENMDLPVFCRQLVNFWSSKGMSGKQILAFLRGLESAGVNLRGDNQTAMDNFSHALEAAIHEAPIFDKQEKRIVVLVGATGVGKTTTLAKMAAYEKMRLKRSVSFISIDDYKIGGADQMGHYARILEVPFLRSRKDMPLEAQVAIQNSETVYIDTFGIAPKDTAKMEMLKSMLQFSDRELAARIEIHLVIPVGVSPKDVKNILESFETLQPKYLLFTKWDETENWGGMLSTILESKKPVSLICFGQNVPDDMSVFSSRKFISTVTEMNSSDQTN